MRIYEKPKLVAIYADDVDIVTASITDTGNDNDGKDKNWGNLFPDM